MGTLDDLVMSSQPEENCDGEDRNPAEEVPPLARERSIRDRVWGSVTLPPLLVAVLDTPEFQRLRTVTQLATLQYVYPGATYNRFEHSIGVAHLAGVFIRHLRAVQLKSPAKAPCFEECDSDEDGTRLKHRPLSFDEIDEERDPERIDDKDVLCVELAGLTHDLGHGPFSHMFEEYMNHSRSQERADGQKRKPFCHEEMSAKLLDQLLRVNNIDIAKYTPRLNRKDIEFVKILMTGLADNARWQEDKWGRPESKRYLLEIVANKRNGLDVDKFDYFCRDSLSMHGNIPAHVPVMRIIGSSRIIPAKSTIGYQEKTAHDILKVFQFRTTMHTEAYQHHTTKVVERMVQDALAAAEDQFSIEGAGGRFIKLKDCDTDLEAYAKLGDWILNAIESCPTQHSEAARILKRIRTRKFYKCVGDPVRLLTSSSRGTIEKEIKAQILDDDDGGGRWQNDVAVVITSIHYGGKEKINGRTSYVNPVKKITFFNPKREETLYEVLVLDLRRAGQGPSLRQL